MSLLNQLKIAGRMWLRHPGLPSLAVASLALAIAAATSVFSVADAALWRPLPLPEPERLVWVTTVDRDVAGASAPGVFSAWAQRAALPTAIAAIRPAEATLRDAAGTDRVGGALVTSSLFEVLGVGAAAGRTLRPDDERTGAEAVLVLSHRLWQTRFGGEPVVGRLVDLDGRTRTIVGVLPAALDAVPLEIDWFAPLALSSAQAANIGPRYLDVIARTGGAPIASLEAELTGIARSVGAKGDTGLPLASRVQPLAAHLGAAPARVLLPLFGAVLVIVLIAAANVASLMLAHGQRRRGEIAVRASLGASRARLVRQLAIEAGLLAVTAGALSLLLSQWLTEALGRTLAATSPSLLPGALDGRAVLFTFVVVSAVTLLVGVLPALRNARTDLRPVLNATSRTVAGGNDRLRRTFVVVQIALAMSLAMAGLLMVQTTRALEQAPRGYAAEGVLTAAVRFPASDYPSGEAIATAADRLVESASAVAGVQGAALSTRVPLAGGAPSSDVALMSEPFTAGVDRQARIRFVTPGFFATIGTPLLEGRDIAAADRAGAAPVVVVNDALARRLSPSRPVVGQSLKFAIAELAPAGARGWEIVGRVEDARDRGPRQPAEPEVYISVSQGPSEVFEWIGRRGLLAVRAAPGARIAPADLRQAVGRTAPGLALYDIRTLEERLFTELSTERLLSRLLVPLGAAGALLAAFGVFAIVAHLVVTRRRELAVRMVLGATPGAILRLTIGEGLILTAGGLVLGTGGALAAGRSLGALTFGVAPLDSSTLLAVVGGTLVLTTLAVWWPARHASRLDPASTLKQD